MSHLMIGHSGCRLQLIEDCENVFVRKTSHHPDYNQRLQKQYLKQSTIDLRFFLQTKVYNSGVNSEGLFYFDMEFIPGNNLAQGFRYLSNRDLKALTHIFSNLYKAEKNYYEAGIFHQKISDIQILLKKDHLELLQAPLVELANYDWSIEMSDVCHGDLGLENVLLFNKELYVIDFLDSFSNSWVIDIAKVLQDIEVHWAFRSQVIDENLSQKLTFFKDQLFQQLLKKGLTFKQYSDCYHVLLLNLYRIIPYSKSEHTDKFLINAIGNIGQKIKTLDLDYEYLNSSLRR